MAARLKTREQLEPKRVQAYYQSITTGWPVEVLPSSEGGGYGMFASREIESGEVIFTEKALAGMQQAENRAYVLACACCHRFTGSLALQAGVLGGEVSRAEIATGSLKASDLPDVSFLLDSTRRELSDDAAAGEAGNSGTAAKGDEASEPIPCPAGCGEVYCSAACLDADNRNGHALLCTGPIDDTEHALVRLKAHACETNDIFLLAARALAQAISAWRINGHDVEAATLPFRCFHGQLWWDAVAPGDENPELRRQCQELVSESVCLLKQALTDLGYWDDDLASFVNEEFFSRLVGTFELNNIGIQIRSPLKVAVDATVKARNGETEGGVSAKVEHLLKEIAKVAEWAHSHTHDEEGSDEEEGAGHDGGEGGGSEQGDELESESGDEDGGLGVHCTEKLGFFDGTGLYSLACMMNHSCLPNVKVLYPDDGRSPGVARVVALCGIQKGEELFHSYLDENLPFARRQATLQSSYGFVCECDRCVAEE